MHCMAAFWWLEGLLRFLYPTNGHLGKSWLVPLGLLLLLLKVALLNWEDTVSSRGISVHTGKLWDVDTYTQLKLNMRVSKEHTTYI